MKHFKRETLLKTLLVAMTTKQRLKQGASFSLQTPSVLSAPPAGKKSPDDHALSLVYPPNKSYLGLLKSAVQLFISYY